MQPITNVEPVDNEFFLRDGGVYFSGLYENGLLKGVMPGDFFCWHYWGKTSTACFMGGVRRQGQNGGLHHQRAGSRRGPVNLRDAG